MLEILLVVLLALWLVGCAAPAAMGGVVHALLSVALIVVMLRLMRGRHADVMRPDER